MTDLYALLLLQYKSAPNLLALIGALIATPYASTLEDITPLRTLYGIGESQGVQLDGIGEIVGQPRPKSFNDADIYAEGIFTLGDSNQSQPELDPDTGFGDINDVNLGGRWDRGTVEGLSLGDIEYQNLLRGRVHVNRSRGTIADYEQYGTIVFGAPANVYPTVGAVFVLFPYYLNSIAIQVVLANIQMTLGIRTNIGAMTVFNRKPFTFGKRRGNGLIEVLADITDEDDTPIVTDDDIPLAAASRSLDVETSPTGAGFARFPNDPLGGYMIKLQTA